MMFYHRKINCKAGCQHKSFFFSKERLFSKDPGAEKITQGQSKAASLLFETSILYSNLSKELSKEKNKKKLCIRGK